MNHHQSASVSASVRCAIVAAALLALMALIVSPASAQGRAQRRGQGSAGDRVSPAEIQRLFDAYVVMQAQKELQLRDDQYPQFLARVKDLQAARQRGLTERARIVQDLRRLNDDSHFDEGRAREQLKALADVEARTATEVREALAAIDQVLDLRQQIRFRIFEEQMERRKLELLVRARQARGQREQGQREQGPREQGPREQGQRDQQR
jgi:hypothetical protein